MGETQSRLYDGPIDNSDKLISAALKGHTETVAKLLKRGKKISKRDEKGDTALHKAAGMGHVEIVQQLLAKGADMTVRNNDGYTPFHHAVICGRVRCCKVLMEAFKDKKDELLADPFPKNPGVLLDYSLNGMSCCC